MEEKLNKVQLNFVTASRNLWQDKTHKSEGIKKRKKVIASQLSQRQLMNTEIIEGILKKIKMSEQKRDKFSQIKIDQADFFKLKMK